MRKWLVTFALAVPLLAAIAALVTWNGIRQFERAPLRAPAGFHLWLPAGTSYAGLVRELERLGVTGADWRWRALGRLQRPTIRAGEYRFESGTTPVELLEVLGSGDVMLHDFTIVEGWTVARLRGELARDSRIRPGTRDLDPEELMHALGCDGCAAEGRFLPETYRFQRGDSDLDLLARAHDSLNETLAAAWADRSSDLALESPDELLVLASLVERETGDAAERGRIAGVFNRRLQRNMRLQTDPTVVYPLGPEFDGRIRRVHLETDHPWNTYTRRGLPPTPIALPGRAAIRAAARPEPGTALYFVSRGDGSHHFSDTLAEHNRAVDRYIRGRGNDG